MNAISQRQHLVPGFIDAEEDEIAPEKRSLDAAFTIALSLALILGTVLLVLGLRG